MLGVGLGGAKASFFTAEAVLKALTRAERQALSKAGAFVRRRARNSIRKRKAVSNPGGPPTDRGGALKRLLFFVFDPTSRSVVVGPVLFEGQREQADAEADQADKGRRVHAEADFGRAVCVDQGRHALARLVDDAVDGDAAAVAAAALHIVGDEMVGHRVEHALRNLRACGIVQEDEVAGLLERREHRPDLLYRKGVGGLMLVH